MGRRKKNSLAEALGYAVLGLIAFVLAVPKEVWIGVGLLAVAWIAFRVFGRSSAKSLPDSSAVGSTQAEGVRRTFAEAKSARASSPASSFRFIEHDAAVPVKLQDGSGEREYRIPPAPQGYGAGGWIPKEASVNVAGISIAGGMIYVGRALAVPSGGNDPCLIDPSRPVAARDGTGASPLGYWPSYEALTPAQRRAYLRWLAEGRRNPHIDIGFVFLFFYGLERRAILDAPRDVAAREELSALADELRRLLSIYGERSNSFLRYATELLNWVTLAEHPAKLYTQPVPAYAKSWELPWHLRLALGQAAVDAVPVPGPLALAWAKLEPSMALRTPAQRCGEQFDALFLQRYGELHGAGLLLPHNRTRLKLVYRPASAGFRGYEELRLSFGDTPDVTVLTAPVRKLQTLAESVTQELDSFSRFVGKNPQHRSTLEGLLLLPATLWPPAARNVLAALCDRMGAGMVSMTFQELLSALQAQSTLTKDRAQAFARALESVNIGMEPDILGGAKVPKPTEPIVLFSIPPVEVVSRTTPSYQAAALTLQLSAALATADGDFNAREISHLRSQIQSWSHLTPNHVRRLTAHLRLLMAAPVSLAVIKKRLEPIDGSAREAIAAFMATVAQSDGAVSPAEVKMLEKLYKVIGVEPAKVFGAVHAVAAGKPVAVATPATVGGFRLDAERIAVLQRETEKVSALLAGIFQEDPAPEASDVEAEGPDVSPEGSGLLGLAEPYCSLARFVLSRPQWTRAELMDAAADLELLLDGALEHINEAAFEQYDMALIEDGEPMTVNAEVLKKIEA